VFPEFDANLSLAIHRGKQLMDLNGRRNGSVDVLSQFIIKHPIWFAIGVSLLDLVLGLLIFIIGSMIGLPEGTLVWTALLALTALPLFLIGWLGWWQDAGFVTITQNTYALASPLVIAMFFLAWFGTIELPGEMIVKLYLAFFLTALSEESLSRGLLLRALLPCGKWHAVLIPSVLFGLGHITHFLFLGMPFGENLLQIVNATVFGFLFAGVRLQVNCIWPLIILHMLFDTFTGLAGIFGIPNASGLNSIPAPFWAIFWMLAIIPGIYFVLRPATVTIDGRGISD
jgi:membrane protease YdiL (CAAX protease family)